MRICRKPSVAEVWIVQHEESPDNTVLGVFATEDEADAFTDEVQGEFSKGVFYSSFPIGYRYTAGAAGYYSKP